MNERDHFGDFNSLILFFHAKMIFSLWLIMLKRNLASLAKTAENWEYHCTKNLIMIFCSHE